MVARRCSGKLESFFNDGFFHSLGAMTIVELRVRGKEMWKELSRGFSHCNEFNPKEDIPKGFEKF